MVQAQRMELEKQLLQSSLAATAAFECAIRNSQKDARAFAWARLEKANAQQNEIKIRLTIQNN